MVVVREEDRSDENYEPLCENVELLKTMTDQNGNPLSSESSNSARPALDPNQLKYRQDFERSYSTRIEAMSEASM